MRYNLQLVSTFPEIEGILSLPEGPTRTSALVEWFQSLFEDEEVPVLVGGAAVELYTAGAYTTGDLDFAGEVTPRVARRLREAGFDKEGRSWRLGDDVFLELPSSSLDPGARAMRLVVGDRSVLVLGVEELLLDRLAAWKHWGSEIDATNALLLWTQHRGRIDDDRVRRLAVEAGLEEALASLLDLTPGRQTLPPQEEIKQWARQRF